MHLFILCHRIGNLLVPNDNYCKFEDWLIPILDQMVLEQKTEVNIFCFTFLIYLFIIVKCLSKRNKKPILDQIVLELKVNLI